MTTVDFDGWFKSLNNLASNFPNRHWTRCNCGRFAKFLSHRASFAGYYSEWDTVECSRCGVVEVDVS